MVTKKDLSRVFGALTDPTRRAILELLRQRALPATRIARRFSKISRPGVSKHLRILREAELVEESRQGRNRIYRLRSEPLLEAERWLGPLASAEPSSGSRGGSGGEGEGSPAAKEPAKQDGSDRDGRGRREDDWRAW